MRQVGRLARLIARWIARLIGLGGLCGGEIWFSFRTPCDLGRRHCKGGFLIKDKCQDLLIHYASSINAWIEAFGMGCERGEIEGKKRRISSDVEIGNKSCNARWGGKSLYFVNKYQ